MAELERIILKYEADIKDLRADLNGVKAQMKDVESTGKKSADGLGSAFKKIGGVIAGVFATQQIISFSKASIAAFNSAKQAESQLLVALKGRVSVQQELIKQASALQKTTLFADDEVVKAQALIAAFVKEEKQIKALTKVTLDFASAKGMDLSSAADLITKTFASSTNALGRYGIEIKGAVGSSQRLASITSQLNAAFEGQAEAASKAGAGGLKQLENAVDDLQESFGELIFGGGKVTTFFKSFIEQLDEGIKVLVKFFRTAEQETNDLIVKASSKQKENLQKLTKEQLEGQKKLLEAGRASLLEKGRPETDPSFPNSFRIQLKQQDFDTQLALLNGQLKAIQEIEQEAASKIASDQVKATDAALERFKAGESERKSVKEQAFEELAQIEKDALDAALKAQEKYYDDIKTLDDINTDTSISLIENEVDQKIAILQKEVDAKGDQIQSSVVSEEEKNEALKQLAISFEDGVKQIRDDARKEEHEAIVKAEKEKNDELLSLKQARLAAENELNQEFINSAMQLSDALIKLVGSETTAGKAAFAFQKALALAQIIINFQKELAEINANPVVNLDVSQATRASLTAAATVRFVTGLATVGSTVIKGFKEGVIDLQGKGTTTSDSIPARLSKHESVMTADETFKYKEELLAMRKNRFKDLIYDKYVMPVLRVNNGYNNNSSFEFSDMGIRKEVKKLNDQSKLNTEYIATKISESNTNSLMAQRRKL